MTAEQRPVVDDLGNIAVHGRSGLVLVVKIETATAGVYENISASDLFFEIGGKLRLALSAGADIYSRQVILTRAQIATLSINQPYAFAIHDETPSTPSTPWTGTITTFGFKAAPTGVPDVDGEAANWTGATVVIQPGGGSPVVVVNYMGQPGVGIPAGGTTGQYLRKSSSTDYATGWDTLTADDVSGLSITLSTLTSADVSLATRLSTEETTRASADTSLATAAAATYLPMAGGVMTGALAAVAGTAALPGLAVAGDLDTGIYGVSANVLGVSAGGSQVQTWGVGTSTLTGNLLAGADNTYDDGALGANRVRSYYAGTSFVAPLGSVGAPSFAFSGDADTGVWSPGAGTWAVSTDGTERLRVTSTGLGLGITPTVPLNVRGSVAEVARFDTSSTGAYISWAIADTRFAYIGSSAHLGGGGGMTDFAIRSDASLRFLSGGGTTRWLMDATGNFLASADSSYDFGGPGANRARTGYFGASVVIGASATPSGVSTANPRVFGVGTNWTVIGGSNVTDATTKNSAIGVAHYTNAEEPMTMLYGLSGAAGNTLNIGGGLSSGNAASEIYFYTAANGTTLTGTARWYMGASGHLIPLADATYDFGSAAAQIRDAYLSRYLKIGGAAPAGAAALGSTIQAFGSLTAFIGGNVLTDATDKVMRVGMLHYLAAEKPIAMIYGIGTTSTNTVFIGGGTSAMNAATDVLIYTGANNATPTGTSRWGWNSAGHYLAQADNAYDIGASGANRPRYVYVGTDVRAGNNVLAGQGWYLGWTGRTLLSAPSDGFLSITNNAGTGVSGIRIGPSTASFPLIKVNGAEAQFRLGDDSGFTKVQGQLKTHATAVAETPTATHTLTLYDAAGTAYRVLCVV